MDDTAEQTLDVETWHLELLNADQLRPARPPRLHGAAVERVVDPAPELSRSFYEHVGRDWLWVDRLTWTTAEWQAWVERRGYELWISRVGTRPAGYLELDGDPLGDVEIASFGLLPDFLGAGLGGDLLTAGVRRAWERGASRVWVHTCSLDGPYARANYEARGFRLYDTTIERLDVPANVDALRMTDAPKFATQS